MVRKPPKGGGWISNNIQAKKGLKIRGTYIHITILYRKVNFLVNMTKNKKPVFEKKTKYLKYYFFFDFLFVQIYLIRLLFAKSNQKKTKLKYSVIFTKIHFKHKKILTYIIFTVYVCFILQYNN